MRTFVTQWRALTIAAAFALLAACGSSIGPGPEEEAPPPTNPNLLAPGPAVTEEEAERLADPESPALDLPVLEVPVPRPIAVPPVGAQ